MSHHGTEPHVEGDTILVHRETFLVELPELAGFDRIELAYYDKDRAGAVRRALGVDLLDGPRFAPAAGPYVYADVAFANGSHPPPPPPAPNANTLLLPEDFSDPDIYRVAGSAAEAVAPWRRGSAVLVGLCAGKHYPHRRRDANDSGTNRPDPSYGPSLSRNVRDGGHGRRHRADSRKRKDCTSKKGRFF